MVHYAAGILPVTVVAGQVLFLVGQDVRDKSWSDFGGKCERVDRQDPSTTACREFYEETYGCLLDHRALRRHMGPATCLPLRSRTQNNHPYWMFVVQVPFQPHLRNAFRKALAFLKHKNLCRVYVEKIDVRWVTWETLVGRLPKRAVFKHTIDLHREVLERIVRHPAEWSTLCLRLNAAPRPPEPPPPGEEPPGPGLTG